MSCIPDALEPTRPFTRSRAVAALVAAARAPAVNFPHYGTLNTSLTATEVSLLSNYTSWAVTNQAATFTKLFGAPGV